MALVFYWEESDFPPSPSRSVPHEFCYWHLQTFMEVKLGCELRYPIGCHLEDRKHNRGQQQRRVRDGAEWFGFSPLRACVAPLRACVAPFSSQPSSWVHLNRKKNNPKMVLKAWLYFGSEWKPRLFMQGDRLARKLQVVCLPAAQWRIFHPKGWNPTKRGVLWDQWEKWGSFGDVLWKMWRLAHVQKFTFLKVFSLLIF